MANTLPNFTQTETQTFARHGFLKFAAAAAALFIAGAAFQNTPAVADPEEPLKAEQPADPAAAAEQAKTQSEASGIFAQARERMRAYTSIRADILETVLLGSRRYRAEGSYLQGTDQQLRLEYKVAVPGADGKPIEGSLLEVSDGSVLQTSYRIGTELRVTRRDVKQILEAIKQNPSMDSEVQASRLGLGGLPSLLASIEKSMTFRSVSTEEIQGTPFVVLKGTWNEDYLTRLRPKDSETLPAYIPDYVWIYFDQESLFPRRVFYLKDDGGKPSPMMTLDFLNIRTNVPVNADDFFFVPPKDVAVQDVTVQMIQQIQNAAAATKAESEKAEAK